MRDHLLYELARDLSSSLELEEVLRKVIDRVITLMKASRGFIVLVEPITGTLSLVMSRGEADPEKASLFLGSRTVIEQVVKTGQAGPPHQPPPQLLAQGPEHGTLHDPLVLIAG